MQATLQKWGNSQGIRIPKAILVSLNIAENDTLDIKSDNNQIIITKAKNKRKNIKELFSNYNGEYVKNADDSLEDAPRGREVW